MRRVARPARGGSAPRDERGARRHEPRWIIVYTFPGVEDWLRDWLLSNRRLEVERVLVPRYEGAPIVPGMLLVEPASDADLDGLVHLPYLTTCLGAPADRRRLTWEEVREVLRSEGARARGLTRRGVVDARTWALSDRYLHPSVRRLPPSTEDDEREARRLLATLSDGSTRQEREEAKVALLVAHGALVEHVVARLGASTRVAHAELLDAGRGGLSQAIERYRQVRGVDVRRYASWWIHQAVVRRISESG